VRIAITGVTGFIGRHLATRALAEGHAVTAFSRRPWTGTPYVPLDDRHFLVLPARPDAGPLAGVDAVVHLAIASQSASDAVTDTVNRIGTKRLFEAAKEAGIGRFVFVSSQSAHAGVESAYGRSKHAVEQDLTGEPGVVIVRPGMVHGDADDGLMGRATRTAAKLRVFPVIGGQAARAQPIDVDALCDALITLATIPDPPRFVMLGDPTVRLLGDLVRGQAKKRYGVSPRPIPVPIGLARTAVRVMSRLHLPSPISEANLDGIEGFEPMDSAADVALMERHAVARAGTTAELAPVTPRRLILVGAGRIGLVHALTAAHHQQMVLAGIVDLDRGAMQRLIAFAGPELPTFTDLDEALRELQPDAAIIGTPPSSHVPLATKLLGAGVDVLVEKPVAASTDDREALAAAAAAHPDRYLATGYLAGLLPHVAAIAPELRAGRLGAPRSFDAHAFVSRVEEGVAEQRDMWELDTSISGGGALVNLGVHVLAMLDLLLGPVEVDTATLVTSGGRAAEDGATLALRAGGVPGHFTTAWHLPGFDMPENHLRIDTDRGYVVLTLSCAAFVEGDEVHMVHQVDADAGFDLAPMDAGGAFWAEQDLLARRAPGANSLDVANRVEDVITNVYRTAARVPAAPAAPQEPILHPATSGNDVTMPDLRGAPDGAVWGGSALVGTEGAPLRGDASIVALPDVPGHFRTLTNKGPVALVRELGVANLGRAAFGVSPRGAVSAAGRSWEALLVLLRAELRRIPRAYTGTIVVDAYLVDLATATGNIAVVEAALDDLRAYCRDARVGVEVNATARFVPHVATLASKLDVVVALGTTREENLAPLRELLPSSAELVVKTGVLPRELLEIAWDVPHRWTHGHGTGRLVVHWPGALNLRALHEAALVRARRAAGLDAAVKP
jgi:predicted dehydrogenase/nucleoside-diphosphate-sugar epimerase